MSIPNLAKRRLLEALLRLPDLLGRYKDRDIVDFINMIWPLREMPSEDGRFQNAWDEVKQHMVNNNDWTLEYALVDRLELLKGEESFFTKFLETIVSPLVRDDLERLNSYVNLINEFIANTNVQLKVVDYFEGVPIYNIRDRNSTNLPAHIDINTVSFYVYKLAENTNFQPPCFVLEYDRWNDYTIITQFRLVYWTENRVKIFIGDVKIMTFDSTHTYEVIYKQFTSLNYLFCSLGQSVDYYENLKKTFPSSYQSVLLALRDAAFFPKIREEFEYHFVFIKSLLRENITERLMRTIRYELLGIDIATRFKFTYRYTPPGTDQVLDLRFDFEYDMELAHRVYTLIGKNGTGKTRILSSIARHLAMDSSPNFSPRRPLYAKVFSVSYSFFDHHDIPEPDSSYNYVYCGLKKPDGGWLSTDELKERFFHSVKTIQVRKLVKEWKSILKKFTPSDFLAALFIEAPDEHGNHEIFDLEQYALRQRMLSSGQSILLYILTEIVAQIRLDSLILYDEPETHLHPNAISELMNSLFYLVEKFESFCIIGTHSPLIVQEMHSRDVYILTRNNEANLTEIRTLEQESFGENLTIITDEIFGNRTIPRHYMQKLKELVDENKTFDEIVRLLEPDAEIPLNLNVKLFIKSLISERS
ncbi:MAG: AAA family ATPase [Bacteroidetes bacterium]|nr:AAA family ATPase [Bacteroidota bacterium]